jgi:hypothetical protein
VHFFGRNAAAYFTASAALSTLRSDLFTEPVSFPVTVAPTVGPKSRLSDL